MKTREIQICHIASVIQDRLGSAPAVLASQDFYTYSYPHILKCFAQVEPGAWTEAKVVEHFLIVYGWMPTAIRTFNQEALTAFAAALNSAAPPNVLIALGARCVNNSVVAASKFLHFWRPSEFAINDSHVTSLLWARVRGFTRDPVARYEIYLAAFSRVSEEIQEQAKRWAQAYYGYSTTPLRAMEGVLFYVARNDGAVAETTADSESQ